MTLPVLASLLIVLRSAPVLGQNATGPAAEVLDPPDSSLVEVAQVCVPVPNLYPCPPTVPVIPPTPTPIVNLSGCDGIQQAIQALPPLGGTVHLPAGVFVCTTPLVIDRDNVELRGEGPSTILRLANGVNAPVLVVGQILAAPNLTRRHIVVGDLVIDGNRANQSVETWPVVPALRNNGISLRHVEDVVVERVTVFSARSGGLVSELGNRQVTVRDFTAFDNQFDGLAGYATENSVFSVLQLHDNVFGAGLSFDLGFNNNVISDAVLTSNHTEGIFMRDSRYNSFSGVQIRQSGEHGIFLGQGAGGPATAPSFNMFTGLIVVDSAGAGIRLNDASIVETIVVVLFARNAGGCVSAEGNAHLSGSVSCQP